jgi:hypothetical protein
MLLRQLFVFGLCLFIEQVPAVERLSIIHVHGQQPYRLFLTPIIASPMSTSNQPASSSTANFTKIFDVATHEYKTITGQDLTTNSFAAALEKLNSPDDFLRVFRTQAQAFDKVYKGNERLMICLNPIVQIIFTVAATLDAMVSLSIFLYYGALTSTLSHSQRQSLRRLAFFWG